MSSLQIIKEETELFVCHPFPTDILRLFDAHRVHYVCILCVQSLPCIINEFCRVTADLSLPLLLGGDASTPLPNITCHSG